MAATIDDIAASVAAFLNGGAWSLGFTAVVSDQPTYKPEDLAELQVAVVPAKHASQRAARKVWRQGYTVWVAVMQRPDPFSAAALAARKALVQEIMVYFENLPSFEAGGVKVTLMTIENDVLMDPDHLEQRQFTSILALTFTAWR